MDEELSPPVQPRGGLSVNKGSSIEGESGFRTVLLFPLELNRETEALCILAVHLKSSTGEKNGVQVITPRGTRVGNCERIGIYRNWKGSLLEPY